MKNVSTFKLEELTTKIGSGATPRGGKNSYKETGISLIRSLNIYDLEFDKDGLAFIDDEQAENLSNVEVKKDDVLINITGASVARCCKVPNDILPARVNQHVSILRTKKDQLNPFFLQYLLVSPYYKHKLLTYAQGGATREALTKGDLQDFEIDLPPIEIQNKIASILSAFDDLIENNSRRIEILEEMARRIYREWFVHFRYPGYENDELVDSDTDFGEIPEGWQVIKLGAVLTKLESGNRPKGGVSRYDNGVPSVGAENVLGVGQYDYSKEKYVPEDFYKEMNKGVVEDYDVLIYKDGASLGRVSIFGDGFPHRKLCINSHAYLVRTDNTCSQSYLYFWMDSPMIKSTIRNSNTNAAQPGINMGDVRGFPFLLPSDRVLKEFDGIGEPIISEIFHLAKMNQNLKETRDLLLPKLISGKIDMGEFTVN